MCWCCSLLHYVCRYVISWDKYEPHHPTMISNEWLAAVCINLEPVRPGESLAWLAGVLAWAGPGCCPPTFRIETPSALIVMSDRPSLLLSWLTTPATSHHWGNRGEISTSSPDLCQYQDNSLTPPPPLLRHHSPSTQHHQTPVGKMKLAPRLTWAALETSGWRHSKHQSWPFV